MKRPYNLAIELITNKKDVYDLNYEQIEEMTKYFEGEIERRKEELGKIKKHIIDMRNMVD